MGQSASVDADGGAAAAEGDAGPRRAPSSPAVAKRPGARGRQDPFDEEEGPEGSFEIDAEEMMRMFSERAQHFRVTPTPSQNREWRDAAFGLADGQFLSAADGPATSAGPAVEQFPMSPKAARLRLRAAEQFNLSPTSSARLCQRVAEQFNMSPTAGTRLRQRAAEQFAMSPKAGARLRQLAEAAGHAPELQRQASVRRMASMDGTASTDSAAFGLSEAQLGRAERLYRAYPSLLGAVDERARADAGGGSDKRCRVCQYESLLDLCTDPEKDTQEVPG